MQRISFAPVLSATRSRDSCWITSISCLSAGSPGAAQRAAPEAWRNCPAGLPAGDLLGLLEDLYDAPALRRGQRPGLHEEDTVADTRGVLLVVRLELVRTADDLAVQRVLDTVLDGDDDGLVHLVADDETLTGLAEAAGSCSLLSHVALTHQALSTVSMPSSRSRIRV